MDPPLLPELPLLEVAPLEEPPPPELALPELAPLEATPPELLAPELELFEPWLPVPLLLEQAQAAEMQVRPIAAMPNCARIFTFPFDGRQARSAR